MFLMFGESKLVKLFFCLLFFVSASFCYAQNFAKNNKELLKQLNECSFSELTDYKINNPTLFITSDMLEENDVNKKVMIPAVLPSLDFVDLNERDVFLSFTSDEIGNFRQKSLFKKYENRFNNDRIENYKRLLLNTIGADATGMFADNQMWPKLSGNNTQITDKEEKIYKTLKIYFTIFNNTKTILENEEFHEKLLSITEK